MASYFENGLKKVKKSFSTQILDNVFFAFKENENLSVFIWFFLKF